MSLADSFHGLDGLSKVTKRERKRALSLNLLETNILKGGIFVNLNRVSFGLSHEQVSIATYGKHHNNRAVGGVDRDIVHDKASMLFSNTMSSTREGLRRQVGCTSGTTSLITMGDMGQFVGRDSSISDCGILDGCEQASYEIRIRGWVVWISDTFTRW